MSLLFALIGTSVLLFFGLGVSRWMLRGVEKVCWLELLGPAWLVGTGLGSVFIAVGGLVLHGLLLQIVLTIGMLSLGWKGWRSAARPVGFFPASAGWERGLWIGLLAPLAWFFWLTFHEPMIWDGVTMWEIKARFAFQNECLNG